MTLKKFVYVQDSDGEFVEVSDSREAMTDIILGARGFLRVITGLDTYISEPSTITEIIVFREFAGTSGSTIVDININGTTIFTTQSNRPSFNYTDGDNKLLTVVPEVTTIPGNARINFDIDQIEGGEPQNIFIRIIRK